MYGNTVLRQPPLKPFKGRAYPGAIPEKERKRKPVDDAPVPDKVRRTEAKEGTVMIEGAHYSFPAKYRTGPGLEPTCYNLKREKDCERLKQYVDRCTRVALGDRKTVLARFTSEQTAIHDRIYDATNGPPFIVTGLAGSGKSEVEKGLWLTCQAARRPCLQLGSTWFSILRIPRGLTLQTACGLDPDTLAVGAYAEQLQCAEDGLRRLPFTLRALAWMEANPGARPLVMVEEASMISAHVVTILMVALRKIFGKEVQVVYFLDATQLPPTNEDAVLCMFSPELADAEVLVLHNNLRQQGELADEFIRFLHHFSMGRVDCEDYLILKHLQQPLATRQGIYCPAAVRHFYYSNADVNSCNADYSNALMTEKYTYVARDTGRTAKSEYLFTGPSNRPPMLEHLTLAIGSEVVFTSAGQLHTVGLPCGVRGVVTGFHRCMVPDQDPLPLPIIYVERHSVTVLVHPVVHNFAPKSRVPRTREQLPLKLGWANTIHVSQGDTIAGGAVVSLKGCDSPGLAYVALSRCTHLRHLQVRDIPEPGPEEASYLPGRLARAGPHPDAKAWCEKHGVFPKLEED